jgi:hypothetical protein
MSSSKQGSPVIFHIRDQDFFVHVGNTFLGHNPKLALAHTSRTNDEVMNSCIYRSDNDYLSRPTILLQLGNHVFALPGEEIVSNIGQCSDFHLALRIAVLRTHMREQGDVIELEEVRIDLWFVREDVQTDRAELQTEKKSTNEHFK